MSERVLNRQEERAKLRAREQLFAVRQGSIQSAPERLAGAGFYCLRCQKDFVSVGRKVVTGEYAWFYAKCSCGGRCIRRITDKLGDIYYFKSKVVRKQQTDASTDMLPPNDPLFRLVYPKQWAKMEKEKYDAGEQ